MKLLLLSLSFIAVVASPAPARAQFGFYVEGWLPYFNDDYNYGWPANPNNPNFDPAAAAINALNQTYGHRRTYSTPIDFSVIDAMEAGLPVGNHRTRCEARYVTYNPRTNLYIGNDGMPHRCR